MSPSPTSLSSFTPFSPRATSTLRGCRPRSLFVFFNIPAVIHCRALVCPVASRPLQIHSISCSVLLCSHSLGQLGQPFFPTPRVSPSFFFSS